MTDKMNEITSSDIRVDKDGVWYYRGAEMIRREIVNFFYQHLTLDEAGRYVIVVPGDRSYILVEDTPFVVRSVWNTPSTGDAGVFRLLLSDDTLETLDPATLWVGAENVLYCRVHDGKFPARFTRAAYYQLAAHMEYDEERGQFFLNSGDRRYYIKINDQQTKQGG